MALIDIIKGHPTAPAQQVAQLGAPTIQVKPTQMSLQDKVQLWQNKPDNKLMQDILKKLNKTMQAAMTSFGGGISQNLRIPAAKLTIQALKSYDRSKGTAVSTHVFHNLKRLSRINSQRSQIVHIPQNIRLAYSTVSNKTTELRQRLGRQPSLQQLADATGLSTKKLSRILQGNAVVSQSGSQLVQGQSNTRGSSDLTDDDYVGYVYHSVQPIDQKILQWSTGFQGAKMLPVGQIAKRLNLSAPAISQRRAKLQQMISQVRGLL